MNDKEKEKLLDLVRKLFNLGDKEKNSSEHEAMLATEKAQKLLADYNISMAEVYANEDEDKESYIEIIDIVAFEFNRTSISLWQKELMTIVRIATETDCYWIKKPRIVQKRNGYGESISFTFVIRFYGTPWDTAVAKELYKYLHDYALKMSKKFYVNDLSKQRSFLHGFCNSLWIRVQEKVNSIKKEQNSNENYALMVINKKDAIQSFREKLIKENNLKLKNSKEQKIDIDYCAYTKGRIEGEKVDLGTEKRLENK